LEGTEKLFDRQKIMRGRLTRKIEKVQTGFVKVNTRNCKACWECINVCPKHVIGKVVFLWHKHITIRNGENCSGCKKCIKICPYGVFTETNEII
jgi:2-oxoglutarate ferredoxin oxidoreductase subunit delta